MKQHVIILGTLYVVMGALGCLLTIGVLVVFGFWWISARIVVEGVPRPEIPPLVTWLGVAILLSFVLFSVPAIVGGIGLIRLRPWSRTVGLAVSVLSVFLFPFGTALGVYGLWVLLSKETESVLKHGTSSSRDPS